MRLYKTMKENIGTDSVEADNSRVLRAFGQEAHVLVSSEQTGDRWGQGITPSVMKRHLGSSRTRPQSIPSVANLIFTGRFEANGSVQFQTFWEHFTFACTRVSSTSANAGKVMEWFQTWLGESPELSVLRMLGLFDRPAAGLFR
jgi:hypothetical protein